MTMNIQSQRGFKFEYLVFAGIVLFYAVICYPHFKDNHFFAPDADRIAMDGAFIKDFILDLPGSLSHPYQYTINYYAKYPALSVGYRPPFFQLVEALFYMVFGTSYVSAKAAVLFFLFTGMFFWMKLVQQTHGFRLAISSLLLWITTPMVYQYSQQSMLEIPTLSMVILSAYAIYQYFERPCVKRALGMAVVMGLTLWTNQKSVFILPAFVGYGLLSGNWKTLFSKSGFSSYAVLLLFIIPLAAMTLWLGDGNLAQSVGTGSGKGSALGVGRLLSSKELLENIHFFYKNHFSILLVVLIVLGLIFAGIKRQSRSLIYISFILSIYAFFTYITHDIPRYSMYWIPFFCLFAALGLEAIAWIAGRFPAVDVKKTAWLLLLVPLIFQLTRLPKVFVQTLSGYEEAARYTLKHSESPVVWFDGYANGHFIFFVNVYDKKREFIVLRADKLISSSSIHYTSKVTIHLHDEAEIAKAFSDMGVQFIVVESDNQSKMKIYDQERDLLRTSPSFELVKTIDVTSNNRKYKGIKLLIYKNLDWPGIHPEKTLKLRLPVIGQTLEVKLARILPEKEDTAE